FLVLFSLVIQVVPRALGQREISKKPDNEMPSNSVWAAAPAIPKSIGHLFGAPTGWLQQNTGTRNALVGVSFNDVNTGTVVEDGRTILRTTNGVQNVVRVYDNAKIPQIP